MARVTLPSSLAIIREWEVIPELPENATFGILRNVPLFFCVKRTRLTAAGHFCFVSPGRSINFHGAFAISKKKEKTAAAAVDLNTNAAVVWL